MRKKFISIMLVILSFLVLFSNVNSTFAVENTMDENESEFPSYHYIHYSGEVQEILLNEDVKLILKGWSNDTKSSVIASLELVYEDTSMNSDFKEITLEVSDALNEINLKDNQTFYYRIDESDAFRLEEVKVTEFKNEVTVLTKNENGTSVEKESVRDEYGTLINNGSLRYYSTIDKNEKVEITEEEYNSINSVIEQLEEPQPTNQLLNENNTLRSTSVQDEQTHVQTTLASGPIKPTISYATHIQGIGWQTPVSDGKTSGTEGEARRLESIKISVGSVNSLGVSYSTHVQDYGWLNSVTDGKESGTTGKGKRLEAIKIELTGSESKNYDVFYRVHAQDYGWMNWVKNGEVAGTMNQSKRLEAIEIMILEKGLTPGTNTDDSQNENAPVDLGPSISYTTHVQGLGWLEPVSNGKLSGTIDQGKRLEAIQISLKDNPYNTGGVTYKTHVQDFGWLRNVSDGAISGTTGQQKRVEAIQLKLTGEVAEHYDIYYRVNTQTFGWLGWAKNDEPAGTEGLTKQVEAIEIVLVKKGEKAPGETNNAFINSNPSVVYSTHVETFGWLNNVSNGKMSGTSGQAKRLEAIKIALEDSPFEGDITYSTHVQNHGWLQNVTNGAISGTSGEAKRLEAIKINLTGEVAKYFDVYYRVHIQGNGWLGWAKNGMKAGSEGQSKRLEAIEIKIVPKGEGEAVQENKAFIFPKTVFIDPGHGGKDPGAIAGGYTEANLNLAVAKKVQSLLVSMGYKVYMSRTDTNTTVDLLERSVMVNNINADLFVSIHHNMAASASANGIESYYYEYDSAYQPKINASMHNNLDRISKSITLSNLIHNNMLGYTGANDRGANGASFSVIREAAMPATLLELGFISNATERQKLITDSYQNKLAKAIADGIDQYFKVY
ncbi:N-acetylmuramoyl-L-alanine amidase [Robertmurraya sp. Marseille-Q9965]